ncbi:hypothetical protein MAR_006347 [Mya arenaria]|uniref:Uncharacterized protein n=1 Tax=Mya arenaria TaxID=6604 RepID=A0ABY7DB95_MYAAR|nr:hypothetical protein MAR_006347 [Mya arenaria]
MFTCSPVHLLFTSVPPCDESNGNSMNKGLEYSTSHGSILAERGPRNMVPLNNYPAGTGKSIVWTGAAYYVPSENRWISQHNYRSLPREARRDAIYFEREDDWVSWKIKNDKPHPPSARGSRESLFNSITKKTG